MSWSEWRSRLVTYTLLYKVYIILYIKYTRTWSVCLCFVQLYNNCTTRYVAVAKRERNLIPHSLLCVYCFFSLFSSLAHCSLISIFCQCLTALAVFIFPVFGDYNGLGLWYGSGRILCAGRCLFTHCCMQLASSRKHARYNFLCLTVLTYWIGPLSH